MDELIGKAAQETRRVVAGVRPAQFDDPTPCSEFNVKQLGNHMAGLLMGSERAARKMDQAPPPDPAPDLLGDNPGPVYAGLADNTVAAWKSPGAFEGMTQFGRGEMPAQMAASITLMEIAVHGWDLAKATGQSYSMDLEVAEATFEAVKQIAPGARESGAFSPEVHVSPGASLQDQIVAYTGRDPDWSA